MTTRDDCIGWLLERLALTTDDLPVTVSRSWNAEHEHGPSILYVGDVLGAVELVDLGAEPYRFGDTFTINLYGHIYEDGIGEVEVGVLGSQVIDAVFLAVSRRPNADDDRLKYMLDIAMPTEVEGPTVLPYATGYAALITFAVECVRHLNRDDPDEVP